MKKPKYQNRYLKQTFKLKATLNGKKNNRKPYRKLVKKKLQDTLDVALADT